MITFREILRQSWIRRAIRNLTTAEPAAFLAKYRLSDIKSLRDPAWEERERSYHDAAMNELNSLVRKYNGLAPYAVRRPYYTRNAEVERAYEASAEDILTGIAERVSGGGSALKRTGSDHEHAQDPESTRKAIEGSPFSFLDFIRNLVARMMARLRG